MPKSINPEMGIGQQLLDFPVSHAKVIFYIVGIIVCFVLGVPCLLGGLTIPFPDLKPILIILGLFLIGVGIWAYLDLRNVRTFRIVAGTEGFTYGTDRNRKLWLWNDIESIWLDAKAIGFWLTNSVGAAIAHTREYSLRHKDGTMLKVYVDKMELGDLIHSEVTKRMFARYKSLYDSGKPVQFGKIVLDQQGISVGKRKLAWPDIQEISVHHGFIEVRKQGKWFNWMDTKTAQIPNVFVFLGLVDENIGVNQKRNL